MAIPMTPSRFGNSFSASTAHYPSAPPSMADTLPSADFGFDDLRQRMSAFTQRFDDFIERGRKRVLEERNAFRTSCAEVEETTRTRHNLIAHLTTASSSHADTLAKEAQETEEMHAAISSLSLQKEEHMSRRSALQQEIATTQTAIKARREAQAAHQRALDAQAAHNAPELKFWEQCLGLRIEGSSSPSGMTLRFVFTCVDPADEGREVWFEIDTAAKEFCVVGTAPKLEREAVEGVQERANEGRDLGVLLKGMRGLFGEALRE